jgi:transcriptional regulator with XRE-family HTH domain
MGVEEFASRLKDLREAAGLTQGELAQRAGVTTDAISRLERGDRKPTWETVLSLAKVLGVRSTAFEGSEGDGGQETPPTPEPRRPGRPRKPDATEPPGQAGSQKGRTAKKGRRKA